MTTPPKTPVNDLSRYAKPKSEKLTIHIDPTPASHNTEKKMSDILRRHPNSPFRQVK